MAIHPSFPTSPYEILNPEHRWFPADEDLRDSSYDKLVPPLVNKVRREVSAWRENGYEGGSKTSKALLNWWFNHQHIREDLKEFQYSLRQSEGIYRLSSFYFRR